MAKLHAAWGLSLVACCTNTKPLVVLSILLTALSSLAKKFLVLKEKTASKSLVLLLVKEYSKAPTGKLLLSSSVGIKGLQPFTVIFNGISASCNCIVPKGNRVV